MGVSNCSIFDTLVKAQILFDREPREYNQIRPHSALGYRQTKPETLLMPMPTPPLRGDAIL